MNIKKIFTLNLKTFVIDLIMFIVGFFLFVGFATLCIYEVGATCSQPALFYVGLILIIISIAHFLINLIILILNKLKKNKKK